MRNAYKGGPAVCTRVTAIGIGVFALSACIASAKVSQLSSGKVATSAKEDVSDALARLHGGDFSPADVDLITRVRGRQAISDFKKQFELTRDKVSNGPLASLPRDALASGLVQLGDDDPAPWDYLAQGVADALASDAPSQVRYDSRGKLIPGPSPEFVAWAKAHSLTTDAALEAVMFDQPTKVTFLAKTGDRRAIPLLRQALSSPNFMVQGSAAQALAQFHDKASIPLIIQACREAPADAAVPMAIALLDFDDPQAQSAAKLFLPAKDAR